MGHVQTSRLIPEKTEEVYKWLANPLNLRQWLKGRIEIDFPKTLLEPLRTHSEFEVLLTRYGFSARAVIRVEEMVPGVRLSYRQVAGVFRQWSHTQLLKAHGKDSTLLTDLVDFQLPLGIFGALVDDLWVRREIESVLNYRLAAIEAQVHKEPASAMRTSIV